LTKIAIKGIQFTQPELIAVVVEIRSVRGIKPQISEILRRHKRNTEVCLTNGIRVGGAQICDSTGGSSCSKSIDSCGSFARGRRQPGRSKQCVHDCLTRSEWKPNGEVRIRDYLLSICLLVLFKFRIRTAISFSLIRDGKTLAVIQGKRTSDVVLIDLK
jgi:hypothetical protein